MRKLMYLIIVIVALGLVVVGCFSVVTPVEKDVADDEANCAIIEDGTILASTGETLTTGYDEWGYNYQAHIFNGYYHNNLRVGDNGTPWTKKTIDQAPSDTRLVMKWNDAWLSNKDCDEDDLLDRHYGYDTPIGSGAWDTNHQWGEYVDKLTGETCKWNYFVKIVAVTESDEVGGPYDLKGNGTWYTFDGTEIGRQIWGAYAIIQQVSNDPCLDEHGILYNSPASPGFGKY